MKQQKLDKICLYIKKLNNNEPLNMDDIDAINKALIEFNGEN